MGELEYSFNVEVAKEYGVNEAILIKNFQFWILKNKANGKNFIDGHYWTFSSHKAFEALFPFWSTQNIKTALKHLEEKGVIIKDNHNQNNYNKTNWYAFKNEDDWLSPCFNSLVKTNQSISENQPIDELELTNQYKDNKQDNKQDNNTPPNEKPLPTPKGGETLSKYGEFENVCLTKECYDKLKLTFGEEKLEYGIDKLDTWLEKTKPNKNTNRNHRGYFKSNSWVWEGYNDNKSEYYLMEWENV